MGDMGDFWRDLRPLLDEESKRKKSRNLSFAIKELNKRGIDYESHNGGIHFVINKNIDYWPTTGKWIFRQSKKQGRGIFNLIKQIGKENT